MNRQKQIEEIRNFNRFYLLRFQILNESLNASNASFIEFSVLEMLNGRNQLLASDLACHLNLSKGYISQLIGKLERRGLIEKERSFRDSRCQLLRLTPNGFSKLMAEQLLHHNRVERFISRLSDEKLDKLVNAMKEIYEVSKTTLSITIISELSEGAD